MNELEKIAETRNKAGKLDGTSLILKIPVPIVMTATGLQPMPSTVDFVGLVQGGKFIAFDAKQTIIKTRFDLKNIHAHQLEYLRLVRNLGGLSFFLIWFKEVSATEGFIVPLSVIEKFWDSERSSVPYKEIEENSIKVPLNDYLTFLNDDNAISKLFK